MFSSQDIPKEPGIYLFRNNEQEVIYVGKAKSLRKRLSTYFQPSRKKHADPKLKALINSIETYEYYVVNSETEALILESRLIKQYRPRYNIDLRDDKRFLLIAVDLNLEFPTLNLVRIQKNDGQKYFGPFPHSRVLRNTLRFLSKYYKIRTCKTKYPTEKQYKHCLEEAFSACCCPCINKITPQQYHSQCLQPILDLFAGKTFTIIAKLQQQMEKYAQKLQYEKSAEIRDMITNIKYIGDPRRRKFTHTTIQNFSDPLTHNHNIIALQKALKLPTIPITIECFDISHISGTLAVGSMVYFKNGKPDNKKYRKYKIKSQATDDTARMKEVLTRRYTRLIKENKPLPDLIIVDGGIPQLNAAINAMQKINMTKIPIISLAKKFEEIYLPMKNSPIRLERNHSGLRLVQYLRDEAHRFAISYNRKLRNEQTTTSVLDSIAGIGTKRKLQLLQQFKSIANLKKVDPKTIAEKIPGIGLQLAKEITKQINTPKKQF